MFTPEQHKEIEIALDRFEETLNWGNLKIHSSNLVQ